MQLSNSNNSLMIHQNPGMGQPNKLTTFEDLPTELTEIILNSLPKGSMPKASLACKAWHNVLIVEVSSINEEQKKIERLRNLEILISVIEGLELYKGQPLGRLTGDFPFPMDRWKTDEYEYLGYDEKVIFIQTKLIEVSPSVTKLSLSGCRMTELPAEIGFLTQLTSLNLSNNELKSLPPEIGFLENLKTLICTWNSLKFIPQEIGDLHQLETMNLLGNKLSFLPVEIGLLTNLKIFNCECNQLNTIPQQIGKLAQLESLYLSRNQLHSLPLEVKKLKNLKHFTIQINALESLPKGILKLKKLEEFILHSNPFTELDKAFLKDKKLMNANPQLEKLREIYRKDKRCSLQ